MDELGLSHHHGALFSAPQPSESHWVPAEHFVFSGPHRIPTTPRSRAPVK